MRLFRKITLKLPWVTDREVTLYDIIRACIIPHAAAICASIVLLYYRGIELSTLRVLAFFCAAVAFIGEPVASTMNLYQNGWGAPDKQFWCNLRAMYRQGHNPMRWAFDAFVDSSLLFATTADAYASASLSLAYHMWSRAETVASVSTFQAESEDFAISLQPLHEEQLAVEGATDPIFVFAGSIIIAASIAHAHYIWAAYLTVHALNTFLYVRRKQSYVQTDLQARIYAFIFRILVTVFIPTYAI